jgi:hypothetical protein
MGACTHPTSQIAAGYDDSFALTSTMPGAFRPADGPLLTGVSGCW